MSKDAAAAASGEFATSPVAVKPAEIPAKADVFREGDYASAVRPTDSSRDALTKIAGEKKVLPVPEKADGQKENMDAFHEINRNIMRLAKIVQRGGEGAAEAKQALGNLLNARESLYQAVASAINPDIRAVPGKDRVYQVGDAQIYGSIIAMVDATPALSGHGALANLIKCRLPEESAQAVMGENLSPKKLVESAIVFSGSSAQDRIQPYGADIDMAEHISIKASTPEEAAALLARSIQASVEEQSEVTDDKGGKIALHFKEMKVGGNYPADAAENLRKEKLRWTVQEIKAGRKEYRNASGGVSVLTLEQACLDPKMIKVDYYGVTDATVTEVTKVTTVVATDSAGSTVLNNSNGQASAFQEVYFDDPTGFGLMEETVDPDKFVDYIAIMSKDMKKYNDPGHLNKMKVAKRMYNVLKSQGDLQAAQELSGLFATDAAAIYQLVDRLGMADEAQKNGINVDRQRQILLDQLQSRLAKNGGADAQAALALLGQSAGGSFDGRIKDLAMRICNAQAESYFQEHQELNESLNGIMES